MREDDHNNFIEMKNAKQIKFLTPRLPQQNVGCRLLRSTSITLPEYKFKLRN